MTAVSIGSGACSRQSTESVSTKSEHLDKLPHSSLWPCQTPQLPTKLQPALKVRLAPQAPSDRLSGSIHNLSKPRRVGNTRARSRANLPALRRLFSFLCCGLAPACQRLKHSENVWLRAEQHYRCNLHSTASAQKICRPQIVLGRAGEEAALWLHHDEILDV